MSKNTITREATYKVGQVVYLGWDEFDNEVCHRLGKVAELSPFFGTYNYRVGSEWYSEENLMSVEDANNIG